MKTYHRPMKTHIYYWLSIVALSLAACQRNNATDEGTQQEKPRTAITLTHAEYGQIDQEAVYSATTAYLKKSVVTAPIPAYITYCAATVGARVRAGQVLYRIESKEQRALGSGAGSSPIVITAAHSGIVLEVMQQAGGYAPEGSVLCSIAETGSLVFEINMPYEDRRQVRTGGHCLLELPDGTRLTATIQAPLATMNTAAQAEQVIARANAPFLPEGLNARAIFQTRKETGIRALILPRSAVQSNETLTQHWVMVLATDSTVRKVPVSTGNSNTTSVEVFSQTLTPRDKVVLTGGYGLEESSKVTVTK